MMDGLLCYAKGLVGVQATPGWRCTSTQRHSLSLTKRISKLEQSFPLGLGPMDAHPWPIAATGSITQWSRVFEEHNPFKKLSHGSNFGNSGNSRSPPAVQLQPAHLPSLLYGIEGQPMQLQG
jgi:hypothetical protein